MDTSTEDIEMQHNARTSSVIDNHHMAAIRILFELPQEQITRWSGALVYCRQLEESFRPLLSEPYAALWDVIGVQRPTSTTACWPWFMAVISAARSLEGDDCSIEDIWDKICITPTGTTPHRPMLEEKTACLI